MRAWVGAIIITLLFFYFSKIFKLFEKGLQVIELSKSTIVIVQRNDLEDFQKEKMLQKNAVNLWGLFFMLVLGFGAALAIPFGIILLMESKKIFVVQEVIQTTLSLKFIGVVFMTSIGYFWVFGRKNKTA